MSEACKGLHEENMYLGIYEEYFEYNNDRGRIVVYITPSGDSYWWDKFKREGEEK